jgi:8-oxo-dGTP pyrophosphatase MutT (NUDIX family)
MEQEPRQRVPRPASTVVLLRPSSSGFEVLMIRRHDEVAFMGGAHVFPGGRLEDGEDHRAAAVRELAEEAGITLDVDALTPFARWVTPEIEAKRYDVWFFLARAPGHQEARHDAHEAVDSVRIRPAHALDRCRRGEIALPPPTWTTLRTLERFGGVDDVLAWANVQEVVPIQPEFATIDGVGTLVMPDTIASERRFVLRDGRWQPAS